MRRAERVRQGTGQAAAWTTAVLVALVLPAPPADAALEEGLLNFWPAEGDGTDVAGGAHVAPANGAGFGAGRCGRAFQLDGVDDSFVAPDHPAWAFGDGDFTISLQARFDADRPSRFIGHDEGPGEHNKWIFAYLGASVAFHVNAPNTVLPQGGYWLGQAPFDAVVGAWHHLAVVRSGDAWTIFVDGVAGPTQTFAVSVPDAQAPLHIGQAENGDFHAGALDEVRIWGRALAPSEILALDACGPVAHVAEIPTLACEAGGATATLDGSGSHDPDGDALAYAWTAAGAAIADPAAAVTTARLGLGTTRVTLTVSDGDPATADATAWRDALVTDEAPPSTTYALDPDASPGGWSREPVQVTLAATDACGPVADTRVRLDGAEETSYAGAILLGEGAHELVFHSIDAAGNAEPPQVLRLGVDAAPPAGAIASVPLLTVDGYGVGWTASDGLSGLAEVVVEELRLLDPAPLFVASCVVPLAGEADASGFCPHDPPAGAHCYRVSVADRAGNRFTSTPTALADAAARLPGLPDLDCGLHA